MASGIAPSTLGSSADSNNSFKLMRLIVDAGTEALRKQFLKIHTGNLQVVLSNSKGILSKLKRHNIISQPQWDKLYPSPSKQANINEFDISLLSVLLRNICNLLPPNSPVWTKPNSTDCSVEADITRVRIFRNERFGHIGNTRVSAADFRTFWAEVSAPLVRLGIDQKEIDLLENEELGQEEINRVLKLWTESELKVLAVLEDHGKVLNSLSDKMNELSDNMDDIKNQGKESVQQEAECQSDSILRKHLVKCDFEREIELHSQKLTEGTRTWVFDEVSAWFHDVTSQNRAFVISGVAGMGKSVIAAVLCKTFAEHLGASHFFQYNNNQYNSSSILLQSIALQLCEVLPAYKVALVEKLSGNLGESLKNMNTEALFTTLLKEPLTNVEDPRKRILIVLDALDEGEYYGKQEVAQLISNHFHKLPSYIRFVITTRPEKNLINKFQKLHPLFIEACDERNLNDVRLVLQNQISSRDLVDRIAKASDGLMLYASLLCEYCKDAPSQTLSIDSLPNGLEGFYEIYFKRLEDELKILNISEEKFLSFLSILAAARGPLPVEFVGILFGLTNNSCSKRQLNKIFNSLSSLLVIKEDQSISPFHKSLSDWLVDSAGHDFTADVESGHQILFDLCIQKFDEMKKTDVKSALQNNVSVKYATKHCIPHMLKIPFEAETMKCFINNHVVDVESMFACVLVDVDLTLINIQSLMNHKRYRSVSNDTCTIVDKLYSLIRKFACYLRNYAETFLQQVVNEGGRELSGKALTLLQTRYKDIIYFELVEKNKAEHPIKARCFLSGEISGIDVSPSHDYVVCSYREGGIELFSLATAKSEWKIKGIVELPVLPKEAVMWPHCLVFHPNQSFILPGRLDRVLSFKGDCITGPFQVDESDSKFTNCCFSRDARTLVTNYKYDLFIWDTLSGARKFHLPCENLLLSFSFTASTNFFGTTDVNNVFRVYDVTSDYVLVKCTKLSFKQLKMKHFPFEIISTYDENSWFIFDGRDMYSISPDLLSLEGSFIGLSDILLPCMLYDCAELQLFLHDPRQSWFRKVREILNETSGWSSYNALRYISLDNNDILVFSRKTNALHVFGKSLLDKESLANKWRCIFSNISSKGDFVYLNDTWAREMTVCNLESKVRRVMSFEQFPQLFIPVVRDGVILYKNDHTPQLWNSDLSQCLVRFNELADANNCLSVSDELIACVYESSVIFFNVCHRKEERRIDFPEPVWEVNACSVHYDALVQMESMSESTFWKNGVKVEGWTENLKDYASIEYISFAQFSPDGNRLAVSSRELSKVVIFDVTSLTFLSQVCVYGPGNDLVRLQFYGNKSLVCGSNNHMLYLINVNRGEIVTCLDLGDIPGPICVSLKKGIVCAGRNYSKYFELIKVCLPRGE